MYTKTQNNVQCSENDVDLFTAHENPFPTQLPDIRHINDGNILSANADTILWPHFPVHSLHKCQTFPTHECQLSSSSAAKIGAPS